MSSENILQTYSTDEEEYIQLVENLINLMTKSDDLNTLMAGTISICSIVAFGLMGVIIGPLAGSVCYTLMTDQKVLDHLRKIKSKGAPHCKKFVSALAFQLEPVSNNNEITIVKEWQTKSRQTLIKTTQTVLESMS
jgi:hypothetical protein